MCVKTKSSNTKSNIIDIEDRERIGWDSVPNGIRNWKKRKFSIYVRFNILMLGLILAPHADTHTHTLKANQEIESMMVLSYGFFTRMLWTLHIERERGIRGGFYAWSCTIAPDAPCGPASHTKQTHRITIQFQFNFLLMKTYIETYKRKHEFEIFIICNFLSRGP